LGGTLELPEPTAGRIRDAVDNLNYSPHASARRLRNGRSETLGFVAPEISNPFFSLMASAIASSAWTLGLDLLVWSSDDVVEREVASVRRLRSSSIDGLLLITHHKSEKILIEQLQGAGPIVFLDEDIAGVPGSRVFVDNEHGGWLATSTLIGMGHTHIAHVGSPADLMSAELRCQGWRKAVAEAGLQTPEAYYMAGPIDQNFGRSALERLMRLPTPPTAIFVGADPIAFGIIAASHEIGLRIPDDLSIISFDGLPVGQLLDPPLSTVVQPIKEMGRKGVELLVRRIETPDAPLAQIILPVTLEMRASAAPRRPPRTTSRAQVVN
jgi:LacI family transcriptional regulator